MRTHFISRLILLLVAGFLVLASQVWSNTTLEWIFIVAGAVMILLAAIGSMREDRAQQMLDALVFLLGAWSIVQAIIFSGNTLEWTSFATAVAGVVIGTIGVVSTTEVRNHSHMLPAS
jgi:predicted membrane channel-forming protein YqfA (hemolysin III family)